MTKRFAGREREMIREFITAFIILSGPFWFSWLFFFLTGAYVR